MATSAHQNLRHGNGIWAIKTLLKLMKVQVTKTAISNVRHALNYPSIQSLSEALDQWNIENLPVKISSQQLTEIPHPSIAHFSNAGLNYFIVVKDVRDGHVHYVHPEKGSINESLKQFEMKWSGNTLLAKSSERSGEMNFHSHQRKERADIFLNRIVLILCGVAATLPFFYFTYSDVVAYSITLAGAVVSVLLLQEQFTRDDIPSPFCSFGKTLDCRQVIHSTTSVIFKSFYVSEICALYFFTGVLAYWLGSPLGLSPSMSLSWLNGCAVLMLPYFILQQWKIGKWCPLCLAISGIILAAFVWNLYYFFEAPALANEVMVVGLSFLIAAAVWLYCRKDLIASINAESERKSLQRFTFDQFIFQSLLNQSSVTHLDYRGMVPFGSQDPKVRITLLSQPDCYACSVAHHVAKNLLLRFPDQVRVEVCLLVSPLVRESVPWKLAENFLASVLCDHSPEKAWNDLSEWYERGEKSHYPQWVTRHHATKFLPEIEETLSADYHKSIANGVLSTPVVLINGKRLPAHYDFIDLQYHLLQWLKFQ